MKEESRINALVWSALLRAYNSGLKSAFQGQFDTVTWVNPDKTETGSCSMCKTLDGVELSLEKAEELFPLHVYCKCFLVPKFTTKKGFTTVEAKSIAEEIHIDWSTSPFDVEEFRKGLDIELEHGLVSPETNVTNDDPILTAKITLAHLNEISDYNTRLLKMEKEAHE